ncbi:GerA spore germination protein [Desulfofarcimen acetoxidans DSM 771]|uniref:GerA spore germination protein n=1 Tax=Desulfofarcimen acetoxidans (strain ATCC 49208 / DSM 771 / KCTC 5769 / VKM B-1644 / 5575) TaxID=485916 RepID=C8VYY8_DESAS|nr:spore germination protein [Desulfofarcimen acetoxidans]ACV62898.1 GerA spore germination protein [Desulfofarcimen acetoxidans DSM 771]
MAQAAEKPRRKVGAKLQDNMDYLKEHLALDANFDLVTREITIAGRDAVIIFENAFCNADLLIKVLIPLLEVKREDLAVDPLRKLFRQKIGHIDVNVAQELEEVVDTVLSGPTALLVDGVDNAFLLDLRHYPVRSPAEPDLEKVVRGSRDGFVETLMFNAALIRRRIRDPKLRFEYMQAGLRSKTDMAICYIEDVANQENVQKIKDSVADIKIDGLPMSEKAVEELITPGSYWNPFPKVRYTERPDVAVAHLLDGHILLLVDNSPSVIITPATYFHHLQHAEEYRQNPTVGIYLRWVRYIGVAISLFLLPLYFLACIHPDILPASLKFIGPKKVGSVPLFLQFIFAELAIDFVRLATIHTPAALATSTGIIAALLIGDLATTIGLFSPEVVLYTAISAIGTFLTPSYELSVANRLVRLFLLVMVGILGLPGFIIGVVLTFVLLLTTKSFGVPYLWPLIPLDMRSLSSVLIRTPVPMINFRPKILKTKDPDRQPVIPQPARKPGKKN